MWITGYTSNKLNDVRTLKRTEPYKVGVNGVFNIQQDFIEYESNSILYKTNFNGNIPFFGSNVNLKNKRKKAYIEPAQLNVVTNRDTVFKVNKTVEDFEYKPLIKEEEKLEQVFLPEIESEIFIERGVNNIYERHMRLMDINNIDQLETYKNGFYYIKKN